MNENDKSQSGLQTAVDFAHAARAVKRIMQAAAVSGVHGAAAATAREAFPVLLKVLVAALVVFIVMPISTRRDPNDYLLRRFLSYKRHYAASFPLKIRCCSFLSASSRLISF